MMRLPSRRRHAKAKQLGAALMIMIVILVMGIVAALIGALSLSALQSARQGKTSAALAQANAALIGYAASNSNMPGSLPCPDLLTNTPGTNVPNDGKSDDFSGNSCPSYVGRLPWHTLGLPELLDGNGERLWYALSPNFRGDNSAQPLNSNTKGTLLVYGPDGVTLQTEAGYDAVAIIFSPGSAFGSQTRNTATEQNSAANYLDTANSRNNASSAGPFIAGAISTTFNDQLLFITSKDLMPLVEKRVAGVVKKAITGYFTANGYYPWADSVAASANYASDIGQNRGWLPDNATTSNSPYSTLDWPLDSRPPDWFFANKWYSLIYYSAAKIHTVNSASCTSCIEDTLIVEDGTNNYEARVLFFMPGTYSGSRAIDNLSHYLEDTQNKDHANDIYVRPTSQAQDRDRLYWLSSSSIWNQ